MILGYLKGSKNVAKDVFSIDVVDDPSQDGSSSSSTSSLSSTPKCVNGETLTVASIILDGDLHSLSPDNRVGLLERAAALIKIPVESLKAKPLGADAKAFDSSALLAGPGNVRGTPRTTGAIVQWQVGCSGLVLPDHSERMTEIEKLSKDGSLADELNFPIIGWHVTNRNQQVPLSVSKREKRQISNQIAGTPVPGIFPTKWPSFTEKIDESTEETYAPESRIVPTMVSPIFSVSSATHQHRHHHGEGGAWDARGGHIPRLVESVRITASPVVVQNRYPFTPGGSPLSTPTLLPERPSLYDTLATVTYVQHSRYLSEDHTDFDGLVSTPIMHSPRVTDIRPTKTYQPGVTKKPPGVPNSKPTIENRMKKLSIIAGKVWSYQIPPNTFVDFEDGDTRSLKLMFMTEDKTSVNPGSWIQMDPEKQTLYALPLDEDIGKYEFILEAMDQEMETTQDRLDIHVRQHPGHRAVHHAFTLGLNFAKWKFPVAIDWQIEVVKKLAKLYGDRNTSQITVRSVTMDPLRISWTNDSLPRHPCPKATIEKLATKLIKDESSGEVTYELAKIMGRGDIKVDEASITYLGTCQAPSVSTTPITRPDSGPVLRNPIEQVNATVGEILRFKVPDDTFFDPEDGSTRYLTLVFLTIDSGVLPKSSWVKLDLKSQELYGLPFENDVGQHEFVMAAQDNNGNTVKDAFIIVVHPRVSRKSSVEFSMHLDVNYSEFSRNISQKVLVAWKLSKLFGDPDPRYIVVNSITKGSVVYSWTNSSLPHDPCPRDKIRSLVTHLFNDNETISARLVEIMHPEFKIIKVDVMPMGVCLGDVDPKVGIASLPDGDVVMPKATDPPDVGTPTETSDDDIYITTIIPAVVIAIMLIIAAMVACFLYRKKRKGKMTMNENGAFVTKGIPIIFADELDEKSDPAKPPVIMKEEKPPLAAPMDYPPRSISASSRDSTPQTDRKEVAHRDTNADYHHPTDPHFSPPYQPPPPFTSSRDTKNSSRPKATPTYRQPPPYVPP